MIDDGTVKKKSCPTLKQIEWIDRFINTFLTTDQNIFLRALHYWGDTPIRTPGRVSVARSEIVIRFLGCPNPENHRVSDLPAPLVGKSRFFTGVQIPEFRIPGV